jgi:uncharacterized protein
MNNKAFKILSIDGGGIKGLYSAALLSALEAKSQKQAGECFDLICGTSTGGLIALALASGKPASELVDLYANHGGKIFPTASNGTLRFFQHTLWRGARQVMFWGKFSNKELRSQLERVFLGSKMEDLNNLVCIPSYNLVRGMPRVFKFPHEEGKFFMDGKILLVDVALATSAAPTYLPIHDYEGALYVDGGIWANNPTLCGVSEAFQFFVGKDRPYSHLEILSIPTISHPGGWVSTAKRKRSFIGWGSKLFQASMDGQAYFTNFFIEKNLDRLAPNSKYVRIKNPSLSPEQMKVIDMDRADRHAIKTLKYLGEADGNTYALQPEVMDFFKSNKTYFTRQ